jgi:flavin-dependent dehydrogenase
MYLTDIDQITQPRDRLAGFAAERLGEAPETRARLPAQADFGAARLSSASSYRTTRVSGGDWLLVGDAACAHDPLSSVGICRALESGLAAAQAIEARLGGERTALDGYEIWTLQQFGDYLIARAACYTSEPRWPEAPFWLRRRAPGAQPQRIAA